MAGLLGELRKQRGAKTEKPYEGIPWGLLGEWIKDNPVDAGLLAGSAAPYPAGDVIGGLADAKHYYQNPEDLTWKNALMSGAAVAVPGIPPFAATLKKLTPQAEVVKALKGLKRSKDGQYIGAPPGVNTPKKMEKIVKEYQDAMLAGKDQREWYETSGRSIFSHAGDDPVLANKLTEAFSTTSANTGVAANTGHAVKAHNQAVLDQPVKAGQFPNTMGPTIDKVYHSGGTTTGMKRTPFGENLALGGKFRHVPNPRPVHDIWDVRAHGYGDDWKGTVGTAQHKFLDTVDDAIIKQANKDKMGGMAGWNPLRSQAAAWRGKQNMIEAAKGKPIPQGMYDFEEHLPKYAAQGSRESMPGATTRHMPELHDAPRPVQQTYDDEVAKIIYDEQGRDRIAMGNKALAGGHIQGPGVFNEASTVPGRQSMMPVGSNALELPNPDKPGKVMKTREMDPASRGMLEATEAQYAFHTGQDAYAGSRLYDAPKDARDAFDLALPGGTIDDEAVLSMMKRAGLDPEDVAVVPTPSGVRLINLGLPADKFNAIAKGSADSLGVKLPAGQRNSGIYGENDWSSSGGLLGQEYAKKFDPEDIPVLGQRFDQTAPGIAQKMKTLDAKFAKEHGFTVSPIIQDLRAAVSAEGRAGIRKMAKRLGLSTSSVAALSIAAEELGLIGTAPEGGEGGAI
jgi:hypothetical protein